MNNCDFVVRNATKKDLSKIIKFNRSMALETEDLYLEKSVIENGVQAVLNDPSKGFYLVCEKDGEVVACLMVTSEWSDWRNGNIWWIQSVYVEKAQRKRGAFKCLYDHLQELSKEEKDIAGVRLYVEKHNDKAKNVYQKRGMVETNYLVYEAMKKNNQI